MALRLELAFKNPSAKFRHAGECRYPGNAASVIVNTPVLAGMTLILGLLDLT
jgi:hypothetical protein